LHFITLERLLPGIQTWPGHKRAMAPSVGESGYASPIQVDAASRLGLVNESGIRSGSSRDK